MHVKDSTNDVDSLSLRDLFYDDTRRTLRRLSMQERGNRVQSREAPIDALNPVFGLNTYMGRLKGRGCSWV